MARRCSTVCLPFDSAGYPEVVADPSAFRRALAGFFREWPELFPDGFGRGYLRKDRRPCRTLGLSLRRVRLKATGGSSTVRPAFALPYMAGRAVVRAAVAPDGRTLAVASGNLFEEGRPHALSLRDAVDGRFLGRVGQDEVYNAVLFGPDGTRLVTAAGRTVRVWRLPPPVQFAEERPARRNDLPPAEFTAAVYTADRTRWAAAGVTSKVARVADTAGPRVVAEVDQPAAAHRGRSGQVALSPDGRTLASLTTEDTVRLWDASTGAPVGAPMLHPNRVSTIAFRPDGRALATGDYSRAVHLWDAGTGSQIGGSIPQEDIVYSLAFSPDGHRLAVGVYRDYSRRCGAAVWDLRSGRPTGPPLHTTTQPDLAFSPCGRTLVTASDGEVRCVTVDGMVPRGRPLQHPPGRAAAAVSPDGRTLATGGSDGVVRLWDFDTLSPRPSTAMGLRGSGVASLTYAPDGQSLAVVTADRLTRLWDVASARPLGPPVVRSARVIGAAFIADGRRLIVTTADGRTGTCPVPVDRIADPRAIERALRTQSGLRLDEGKVVVPLSQEEWHRCTQR